MTLHGRELRLNSTTSMTIAQELRAVGQGLESLEVEDFDLQGEGNGYFALGIPRTLIRSPDMIRFDKTFALNWVRNVWRSFIGDSSPERKLADPGPDVLRILFTPEGLLRLDAAGIAKRNPHVPGSPDSNKLGQILRIVGECLDAKSGRLLKIRKQRQLVSFEYATRADEHAIEEWKVSELCEIWLDASNQRQTRANAVDRKPQGERR
jgi:hypothetical protein